MTEQKVKKRGWVKNAAIIFLAVMLVLTFFSNTIMNRSLPEVAEQMTQSGTISAKIRGTGTVTANESYEVKTEQTREVLSVPVKVGDKVVVGDTLLLFGDAKSTELETAQKEYDGLLLEYQGLVIDATGSGNYSSELRKIQNAQDALAKAKADRDANVISDAELATAKANASRAANAYDIQQLKVTALQNQLGNMTAPSDNSAAYAAIQAVQAQITAKNNEIASLMLVYGDAYNDLIAYATAWRGSDTTKTVEVYTEALYKYLLSGNTSLPYAGAPAITDSEISSMTTAYSKIKTAKDELAALNADLAEKQKDINYGDSNYNTIKNQLTEANNTLSSLATVKQNFSDVYTDMQAKKTAYDSAVAAVNSSQETLEGLIDTLATKKKTDQKAQLTIDAKKKEIALKKEAIAKLQSGGEGATVTSNVNGIIASINVTAGNTTAADTALMTIEVPDRGYGINISVTSEQSKKVQLGDMGNIDYYYGSDLTATLTAIKPDPQSQGTKKLLCFKLQGEVDSGTQLSVSIGERGGSYETIVPNSAVRSDNNGSFVLLVVSKNGPLGNRYIAERVDVKVLATDDLNSAVSGGLSQGDFVITTSSKPVESGMQVRLPD